MIDRLANWMIDGASSSAKAVQGYTRFAGAVDAGAGFGSQGVAGLPGSPARDKLMLIFSSAQCLSLVIPRLGEYHPTTFTDSRRLPLANTPGSIDTTRK